MLHWIDNFEYLIMAFSCYLPRFFDSIQLHLKVWLMFRSC
jgi:hypothetical protein